MDDLEKVAKFEGYFDDAKEEFEALKKKLTHNVARDLDNNKRYIKNLLDNDIVAAYYYQAGAIRNSLCFDKQVKRAVEILSDPVEYKRLLTPKPSVNPVPQNQKPAKKSKSTRKNKK